MTKAKISRKISEDAFISKKDSINILNSFVNIIKKESQTKQIKITNFGTFKFKLTKQRIGRNPKTKESYIIPSMQKLVFIASMQSKKLCN